MELEESTCLTSGSTTKPQSSDSMVLAQRQEYRSMEQNRKPRDKSTHIWRRLLRVPWRSKEMKPVNPKGTQP